MSRPAWLGLALLLTTGLTACSRGEPRETGELARALSGLGLADVRFERARAEGGSVMLEGVRARLAGVGEVRIASVEARDWTGASETWSASRILLTRVEGDGVRIDEASYDRPEAKTGAPAFAQFVASGYAAPLWGMPVRAQRVFVSASGRSMGVMGLALDTFIPGAAWGEDALAGEIELTDTAEGLRISGSGRSTRSGNLSAQLVLAGLRRVDLVPPTGLAGIAARPALPESAGLADARITLAIQGRPSAPSPLPRLEAWPDPVVRQVAGALAKGIETGRALVEIGLRPVAPVPLAGFLAALSRPDASETLGLRASGPDVEPIRQETVPAAAR